MVKSSLKKGLALAVMASMVPAMEAASSNISMYSAVDEVINQEPEIITPSAPTCNKTIPPNFVTSVARKATIAMHDFITHRDDETDREGLKAYQTSNVPGRGREFVMEFQLPQGKHTSATLTLNKTWDGKEHHQRCSSHVIQLARLDNNAFYTSREGVSITEGSQVEYPFTSDYKQFSFDITKLLEVSPTTTSLFVLVREKNTSCLTIFDHKNNKPEVHLDYKEEVVDDRKMGPYKIHCLDGDCSTRRINICHNS